MGRLLDMTEFWSGAVTMAYLVAALFFLRFWRRSRDPFFLMFSLAFVILAINRVSMIAWRGGEQDAAMYVGRLIAYLLLLVALVIKNRTPRRGGEAPPPPRTTLEIEPRDGPAR